MKQIVLAAALLAAAAPSATADQITVENIGSVFNQSLALPAQDTPGSGIGFEQYFEFTLPVSEIVTVSMSDSGIGSLAIVGGLLSLNDFTSSAPVSPFQPIGALIESAPLNNVVGGQEATVSPDVLTAGSYFTELSGVSGSSPIHLAIDGTITATTDVVPGPVVGAGLPGLIAGCVLLVALRRRASRHRERQLAV